MALRRTSRDIVEAERPKRRLISCRLWPWTISSAISSRSANDKYLPDSGFAAGLNIAGGIPPAFGNHLVPTGCDTPAFIAAASLLIPVAISDQNSCPSLRVATGGRPGDRNRGRVHRSERRFLLSIHASIFEALRRPVESAQYTSEQFQRLIADNGVTYSMSRSGNVWDNATMESFFSSMKTERIGRKTYRTRNHAKADVFDYIERFYNPTRRHSTLGYLRPMDFERQAHVA